MERRNFLKNSFLLSVGGLMSSRVEMAAAMEAVATAKEAGKKLSSKELYDLFRNPDSHYRPFVRWWWNGDKVEADELKRELKLLKDAGIGGVEINPIKFPARGTDDLGKKSLPWLSDEWIDMVKVACDEAKRLDMTSDLLVGSGWPFGAEYLTGDERADIMVNHSIKLQGPIDYEASDDGLFCAADPKISSSFIGRKMELVSLYLVPEPFNNLDQAIDVKSKGVNGVYKFKIPEGKWVLFALIKIHGFLEVILGAPGANGPVLNHFNKSAVENYLNRMSETIENRIGPLKQHIRALFTDSMELEGANWTADFESEFRKRRGYDLMPYFPFLLFKCGSMGNVLTYEPKVEFGKELGEKINRVRYDFEYTKAELLLERFTQTYLDWCKKLGVKSRAQAYGRGLFPLENSLGYDIPECESWTTNWLRHKIGEEMSEEDYRRGRAYTMVNKYVSSAAHLAGKRLVSCEEMTNTYLVFNMTLEFLKIGGDQTAISGVTHSIFHGFNYSPNKELPFPGWIRYGAYYSERNNWWPYFKYYTAYKGRLSTALQHGTMYADIALLYPIGDMWSTMGMQNEPFPSDTNVKYKTLVWEAINKNGSGCDYVSESIIQKAEMKDGALHYGSRKYTTLFLVEVESMHPETARKLYDFVACGGRIFCIEAYPHKSLGLSNFEARDKEVVELVEKMKTMEDRFIMVKKPEKDFIGWYKDLQKKYAISSYMTIEKPDPYLMQNRYQTDDKAEMFFISHSHRYNSLQTKIRFHKEITKGRQAWIWDLESGERYKLNLDEEGGFSFDFGPGDSLLVMFDKNKRGNEWKPLPTTGVNKQDLTSNWDVEFRYSLEDTVKKDHFDKLVNLLDSEKYIGFSGTAVYKKKVNISSPENMVLNLGQVHGVSEVFINGKSCGVKWYGRRIYLLKDMLVSGENTIEVHVITTMGNYIKRMEENEKNKVAQSWVKKQDDQPMGLVGPVELYKLS